ncbi:hypothetical protein [Marinifilum sp.]|uniref:hypothetical protein n=1 Tax=Marinifilum sp. TaxID=2033137 RepID=UPI003BAD1AD1
MQQFLSGFEFAFSYLISLSYFDHFLILFLFGIVFQFKDLKNILSLFLAICIGTIAGFLLAIFKVTFFSIATIKLATAFAFLTVGVHHIISNSLSANAIRYNFFAAIGLVTGTGICFHYVKGFGRSIQFLHTSGYGLGILAAYFLISLAGLLISSLIIVVFKTDRRSFNLGISGIGIGIALVLIYMRY